MKTIYKDESFEIFEPTLENNTTIYPVEVFDKTFYLTLDDEGFWRADNLMDSIASKIGSIIEDKEL